VNHRSHCLNHLTIRIDTVYKKLTRCCRLRLPQRRIQSAVASVDVGAEIDQTILTKPHCPIQYVDINWFRNLYRLLDGFAAAQAGSDFCRWPSWMVAQEIFCEFNRFFHANASGAEIPPRFSKQILRRRVMKIYVELIRKHELYSAKSILWSGRLPEPIFKIGSRYGFPIDIARIDLSGIWPPALKTFILCWLKNCGSFFILGNRSFLAILFGTSHDGFITR